MKKIIKISTVAFVLGVAFNSFAEESANLAQQNVDLTPTTMAFQSWMSPEVNAAWSKGYKGASSKITFIDDFSSTSKFYGNLGEGVKLQRHGEWTRREAQLEAPSATFASIDFKSTSSKVSLSTATVLSVVNASYGLMAPTGYNVSQINFGTLQSSVVSAAKNGQAIVSKAAGNDGVNIGSSVNGNTDYLSLALKGTPTTIYVGALNTNGTTAAPATIASYSNKAGSDIDIQNKYLMVGVEGSKTNLYGTSFAAPIVSAYAGIVKSKFKTATPLQVTNQLLNTARKDTISGYNAAIHGRGEASLTRALAPTTIQ